MKRNVFFYTLTLTALLIIGCGQQTAPQNTNTPASESVPPSASSDSSNATAQQQTASEENHVEDSQVEGSHAAENRPGTTDMISEETAKEIALSHAGLTAEQVTFIKSGLDRDDGKKNYDIEFYTADHKEYDYEIDPYTGEILDFDYDAEYYSQHTTATEGENTAAGENSTAGSIISEEEAKQLVLSKIPGAAHEHFRKFKSDYDNSRLQYEGTIYFEQKEYEFEIDGHTGEILEWDVEPVYGNE